MRRMESGCVGCGLPCRHERCKYYRVEVSECDACGNDLEDLYDVDGKDLCRDCIVNQYIGEIRKDFYDDMPDAAGADENEAEDYLYQDYAPKWVDEHFEKVVEG